MVFLFLLEALGRNSKSFPLEKKFHRVDASANLWCYVHGMLNYAQQLYRPHTKGAALHFWNGTVPLRSRFRGSWNQHSPVSIDRAALWEAISHADFCPVCLVCSSLVILHSTCGGYSSQVALPSLSDHNLGRRRVSICQVDSQRLGILEERLFVSWNRVSQYCLGCSEPVNVTKLVSSLIRSPCIPKTGVAGVYLQAWWERHCLSIYY